MDERQHSSYEDAGVSASTNGVVNLYKDIKMYETTQQVPEGLSMHVPAPEEEQLVWYKELLKAWKKEEATPTSEQATQLVLNTFQRIYPGGFDLFDIGGFLSFYGLPDYRSMTRAKASPVAEKAFLLLNTLPVEKNRVKDWCHFTVSVEVKKFSLLPSKILFAICERRKALAKRDHDRANKWLEEITNKDYEVKRIDKVEVLTQKYEIRLRGFKKPGVLSEAEAKDKLVKMVAGKRLMIKVEKVDDNLDCVGDAFCSGTLLEMQKELVMEGSLPAMTTPGVSEDMEIELKAREGRELVNSQGW